MGRGAMEEGGGGGNSIAGNGVNGVGQKCLWYT